MAADDTTAFSAGIADDTAVFSAGIAALTTGNYSDAVKYFSDAIALSPSKHFLYSNRFKAHALLALSDAQKTVELSPNWCSTDLGAAYLSLLKFSDVLTGDRTPSVSCDDEDGEVIVWKGMDKMAESEQLRYTDHKIADEECQKGNEFHKQRKFLEAIKHYTEAIKRNPQNPKAFSQRAASYMSLESFSEALKDAIKCIELDPTSADGYASKGAVHCVMKDYEKAMESYEEALKLDPGNKKWNLGVRRCNSGLKERKMKEAVEKKQEEEAAKARKKVPRSRRATHQDLGLKLPGNQLGKNFNG